MFYSLYKNADYGTSAPNITKAGACDSSETAPEHIVDKCHIEI
jgi:hypothetical protein